ncbi:MAG TPA: NAD(P)-binding protein [Candidatus Limnocylindrales bacterium]|nr:NAD(P)-binding protein [Candidatus Limnocylindrales bacterium]
MKKPFAITLDVRSSLANHTGAWRSERPVYVDGLPPCNHACPAGEQVQAWLYAAEEGDYETAWRRLVNDNPFPAIMGRVCYHPCQTVCNRAELDSAVGINSVERFLGDEAIRQGWQLPDPAPPTGKRVLIVGAGPAGLSTAYQLRLLGHDIEIHEAGGQAGGMMRFGIPTFRLPRDVLDSEIDRLLTLGITLKLNTRITDLATTMREGGFDAAFLAIGAQLSHRAYIPAGQAARILDALNVLAGAAEGERPQLGRTVIVYGGGNTAMDAARTAKRLGAQDAIVVYRRTQAQMPANEIELREALDEGVEVKWLRTITQVGDGVLTLEKMRLDEDGRPQPTGEFEELAGDSVILALGQDVERTILETLPGVRIVDGVVQVDASMMTGCPGVFAGGDMVPSTRSVTVGIGHGKAAAVNIDRWLRGVPSTPAVGGQVPVAFGSLNPWYYSDAPHAVRPRLDAGRRVADFSEVVGGLDVDTALYEARRCMSCGNCFGCDNCFGVCPDNAVLKVDEAHGYAFNYDYCKGCGLCAAECPCGAIIMQPETS